jgi:uncharacterized protein YjbI with pentapeptide repeats
MADGKDKPKSPAGADDKPSSFAETDGIDWFIMSDFNDLLSGNSTTLKPTTPPTTSPKVPQSAPDQPSVKKTLATNPLPTNQGNPFVNSEDEDDAAWLAELDLDSPVVSDLGFTATVLSTPKTLGKDLTKDSPKDLPQTAPPQPSATSDRNSNANVEVAPPAGIDWLILSDLGDSVSEGGTRKPEAKTDTKSANTQNASVKPQPSPNSPPDLSLDFGSKDSAQFLAEFGSSFDDDFAQDLADDFMNEAALENLGVDEDLGLSDINTLPTPLGAGLDAATLDDELGEGLSDDLDFLLADEPDSHNSSLGNSAQNNFAEMGNDLIDLATNNDSDADEWLQGFDDEPESPAVVSDSPVVPQIDLGAADISQDNFDDFDGSQNLQEDLKGDLKENGIGNEPKSKNPTTPLQNTPPEASLAESLAEPLVDNIWESSNTAYDNDINWQSDGNSAPWDQPIPTTTPATPTLDSDPLDTAIVFDFNQFPEASGADEAEDWLNTQTSYQSEGMGKNTTGSMGSTTANKDEFGDMVWHIPSTDDDDFGDTVVTGWLEPVESTANNSSSAQLDPFASNWNSPSVPQQVSPPMVATPNHIEAVTVVTSETVLHAPLNPVAHPNAGQSSFEDSELLADFENGFENGIDDWSDQSNLSADADIAPSADYGQSNVLDNANIAHAQSLDATNLASITYDFGAQSSSNYSDNYSDQASADFWENEFDAILDPEELSPWDSAQIDPSQIDPSEYVDNLANELFQDAPSLEELSPEHPSATNREASPPSQPSFQPSSQVTTLRAVDTSGVADFADEFENQFGHELGNTFDQIGNEFADYNDPAAGYQDNYQENYQEFIADSGLADDFPITNPVANPASGFSSGAVASFPSTAHSGLPYGGDGLNLDPYGATELEVDLDDFNAVLADDFIPSDYLSTDYHHSAGATGLMPATPPSAAPTYNPPPQSGYTNNATSVSSPSPGSFTKPNNPPMGTIDNDYLDNFDLDEFDSSVGGLAAMQAGSDPSFSQGGQSGYAPPPSPSTAHNPLPLPPLPKMPPLPPLPHTGNKGANHGNTGSTAASNVAPKPYNTPPQPSMQPNMGNAASTSTSGTTAYRSRGSDSGAAFDDDFLRNAGRANSSNSVGNTSGMDTGFNTGFNMGGSPVLSNFNDIGALDIRDDTDWTGLLDGDSELSDSFTAMPVSSYATPKLPDQSGFFTGETDDLPRHRQPPLAGMNNTGLTGFGPRPTPTPQIADNFKAPYPPGQTGFGAPGMGAEKDSDRPSLPVSISIEAIWDKAKWPIVGLILLMIGGGGMMLLQRPYTELGLKIGFIKDASGKNLQGMNFKDAKLENVNFSGANLEAAVFENANLKGADLSDAKLDGVNFARANLRGTRLLRTSIVWANFKGAQLNLADLEGADVNRSNFAGATLQGANLRGMKLGEGDKMARLEPRDRLMWQLVNEPKPGRNLAGQNLSGFNLNGAVLAGANLTNSQLSFVDLTGADLKNANLAGATVKGMNLTGAKLNGAQFAGAIWDKDKPPRTDGTTVCPNGKPGPCKF